MQNLEFVPIDGALGARVRGGGPGLEFDTDEIARIKEALAQYHVLVFEPAQRTDTQLNRFMSCIGRPMGTPGLDRDDDDPTALSAEALKTRDEFNVLRVEDNPDHPSPVLRNNDFEWHTDQAIFQGIRGTATVLQAEVIAEEGGDTYFVSTYEAYEELPNALKMRLDGVRVIGDQRAYTEGFFDPEAARAVNPLVITHPESGNRALFFQPYATIGILDLPADEADDLLVELTERVLQPQRIYRHHWTEGEAVLFDTWGTWHRRDSWGEGQQRLLKMIQNSTPVPVFPIPADAPVADPRDMSMLRFGITGDHDPVGAAVTWARELVGKRKAQRADGELTPAGTGA
jgi:alpha-ketoglutarate-dependent taurine dioxygenase